MTETLPQPPQDEQVKIAVETPLRSADRLKLEAQARHDKAQERRDAVKNGVLGGLRRIGATITAAKESLVATYNAAAETKAAKIAVAPLKFVREPVAYITDARAGIASVYDKATDGLANGLERVQGYLGDRSANVSSTYEEDRAKLQATVDQLRADARDVLQNGGTTTEAKKLLTEAAAVESRVSQLESHRDFFAKKSEKHAQNRQNGTWLSKFLRNRGA